jgi:predicted enzyme related to lactoylglutathione lyase
MPRINLNRETHMHAQSLELAWIVVKDLKQAVKFYTETVGLKLLELHEEAGWAELQGAEGGALLGIARAKDEGGCSGQPGQNACVTFTVKDVEQARQAMEAKGARCMGSIEEVPGHVKLQMVVDADGNRFQLVQKLF